MTEQTISEMKKEERRIMTGAVSTLSESMRCWMPSVFHPPLPRRLPDFVPLFLPLCGHFYAILPALLSNRNPYENYVRDRKREWGSERKTRRGKRKERRGQERGQRMEHTEGWRLPV